MRSLTGQIIFPDHQSAGSIEFGSHIEKITPLKEAPDTYILPGFVDGHVHGGDGADTMDGVEAIRKMALFHLRHGTTTILPTTITRPWEDILTVLEAISRVMKEGVPNGPHIHGAHIEGPFVSPHKLGAQPAFAIEPTAERVDELIKSGCVSLVTIAPELAHSDTAMESFAKAGIRVSLGHTVANYEQTERALCIICGAGGTAGATHLFNAMPSIQGRDPGPVTAFMCHDVAYAEMIFDTHHVHPATFRLASKTMDNRLLFVTDAMRGAGQEDGPSQLGGQDVMIKEGVVRLPNGSLAGSVLTLDQAFRNAVRHGASLSKASRLVSTNAARYLGLHDRGEICEGKLADFAVMDRDFRIKEMWVAGNKVFSREGSLSDS
ncbi:N-acetylglucosamine-6-phosphate deacetylase [Aristophania vespae]|uniref:N-acetylglucosamine-6-phosphate deacetylase n=1 Tax=Aristophania vespae TaxID=2697033 RepID=UPI0023515C54|nr:N-acetylglucosamine-6-phosphate deacetylase [Aristophania vespae]UMM63861.1 N-acetylgalactosamine-6-phosphate deacetylase [Aristophania vespae]